MNHRQHVGRAEVKKPLRVLIVEDSEDDTLLVVRELQHGDYSPIFQRVDTATAMQNALRNQEWDAIIADYNLPSFNALEALHLLKDSGLDLPFIVVTGSITDDTAVAAMKAGAHDYIMKGNLKRLVTAIERELREAENRRERKHLQKRVVEYEELNKLKSNLLSTVSHELRTPLTTIKGYSTMLLDYDNRLEQDEKQEYLSAIDRATDRMTELIDHLLDLSRLEAGILKLDKTPTNVRALFQTIVDEARLRAPEHKIVLNLPNMALNLNVDGRRIRQVVDNLINNATKYSEMGSTVTIEAQMKNSKLVASVSDQGIGIPRENWDKIFDRMFNLEHRLAQEPGGLGLGLALCKALVEAHGGRIWVESEPGKGSIFYFTLPREAIV
jgi:signal transduction histidine kinase